MRFDFSISLGYFLKEEGTNSRTLYIDAYPTCIEKNVRQSNKNLDSVGEGESGIIWENGIETCII